MGSRNLESVRALGSVAERSRLLGVSGGHASFAAGAAGAAAAGTAAAGAGDAPARHVDVFVLPAPDQSPSGSFNRHVSASRLLNFEAESFHSAAETDGGQGASAQECAPGCAKEVGHLQLADELPSTLEDSCTAEAGSDALPPPVHKSAGSAPCAEHSEATHTAAQLLAALRSSPDQSCPQPAGVPAAPGGAGAVASIAGIFGAIFDTYSTAAEQTPPHGGTQHAEPPLHAEVATAGTVIAAARERGLPPTRLPRGPPRSRRSSSAGRSPL